MSDLKACEQRNKLIAFTKKYFKDKTFDNYIYRRRDNCMVLAYDFICELNRAFETLEQQNARANPWIAFKADDESTWPESVNDEHLCKDNNGSCETLTFTAYLWKEWGITHYMIIPGDNQC